MKKCRGCNGELTHDKERDCYVCLNCNPTPKPRKPEKPKERTYVDRGMTEEMVREICMDVLENWHVKKPSVTVEEIDEIVKPKSWQEQAKDLGINPYGRKKEVVLAEITSRLAEQTEPPDDGQDKE